MTSTHGPQPEPPERPATRPSRRSRNAAPRPHRIKFVVDDDEQALVTAAARQAGMSVGTYAATATLSAAATATRPTLAEPREFLGRFVAATAAVTENWRALRTIGGLLNQVAAVGNSTGTLPPQTAQVLDQVARVTRRVDDAATELRARADPDVHEPVPPAVIGKVSRGWREGGLLRYLLGPGRSNEHTDPHVVASWDGRPHPWQPRRDAHAWQPRRDARGRFDCRDLAAALAAPQLAAGLPLTKPANGVGRKVPQGPVWHCSLRNHAEDRVLSDAEWTEIARDVLDRTGIAPRDDPFACRWVVVRHADDHVHVAAVLVRQDTARRVHPKFDHRRVGQVARETEARLGLTPTGAPDRTAPRRATRAEHEKARRQAAAYGSGRDTAPEQPTRTVLCQEARKASLRARSAEKFLELLEAAPLARARVHRDQSGHVDGYALSLVGETNAAGRPVWFSGSRLARDLSMPRLRAVWASAPAPPPPLPREPTEHFSAGRAEYLGALDQATRAVHDATEAVHNARTTHHPVRDADSVSGTGQAAVADGVAHSLRDLLTTLGVGARQTYPDLGDAADLFDRAARTPHTVLPKHWSDEARHLRTATWRLAAIKTLPGRGAGREPLAALVAAVVVLVAEIASYQATRQRLAQARAARRCADTLATSCERLEYSSSGAVGVARRQPSTPTRRAHQPAPTSAPHPVPQPGPRPPTSPPQASRRGRGR